MSPTDELAANAAKCAKLAQSAKTETDRARWLEMERFWSNKLATPVQEDAPPDKFLIDL